MSDLLNATTLVLFLVLLAWSAWRAVAERSVVARDVALVFAPFAVILLVPLATQLLASAPIGLAQVSSLVLLAQPVFALKLVADIRPVPRLLLIAAVLVYAVTAIPVVLLGQSAGAFALAAAADFVITETVAAAYLGREAIRRNGSARVRLAVAAFATAAVASVLVVASVGAVAHVAETTPVVRVIALFALGGYWIAFLPPRRLREYWQATAAYTQGERLLAAPAIVDAGALWSQFATSVARLTSSAVVVVQVDRESRLVVVATTADMDVLDRAYDKEGLESLIAGKGHDVVARDLLDRTGTHAAQVVPLVTDRVATGAVVLLRQRPSLFDSDDAALVAALAIRSAYLVERREILAEQERLTVRLEETVAALRSASAAKSDFVASMSHELRTPLNAIIGFSELMAGEPEESGSITVPTEWIGHIRSGGAHLLGLINDILDLAKVEAGRLELSVEPVDLSHAVVESVAGLRPLADRKRQRIDVSGDSIVVEADAGRLRQILYNLLSNAIKYTPPEGSISVRVASSGGAARVTVEDTGVGIAEADFGHVFEEFRQVGERADQEGGTGLGLALTKRLVEAHGGRLELESTVGIGSRFTVVLPDARVSQVESATPSPVIVAPAGGDVLIIEDEPSSVRLLQAYLEESGHRVRVAPDGETGLSLAHAAAPAAILLDVLLPGMDGWEVLRRLKSDVALRDIPVIIVTVVDERGVGMALGAVDYLLKPVERDALVSRLARHAIRANVREAGTKILAIDDDEASLDLIEESLVPLGFSVTRAASGLAGIAIAGQAVPDLVICDLLMPGMDGFEVIERLRHDANTASVPILVLTAHALTDADKSRLNGRILGLVGKGESASAGLRTWLTTVLPDAGLARPQLTS
ncbi:MAG TPA: response regulator [Candidatus Limnocylindrales bacterium]